MATSDFNSRDYDPGFNSDPRFIKQQAENMLADSLGKVKSLPMESQLSFFSIFNQAKSATHAQLLYLFAEIAYLHFFHLTTVRECLKPFSDSPTSLKD